MITIRTRMREFERESQYNGINSIDVVAKNSLNTPIFDEYADSDNRKSKESGLNEMNGTWKTGDITVGLPVSLKKPCYLEQSTEAQTNKINSCYNILEDGIIDKRDILVKEYKDFYQKMKFRYAPNENIYYMGDQKLSIQLRQKMLGLDKIMEAYKAPLSDPLIGFDANSKTSYENIMEKFENKEELFQLLILIRQSVLYDGISLCDKYSRKSSTVATNLGPHIQEDVLKFVLRALEQFQRLSRRVLVYYVAFMLRNDYPEVSKKDIGHVVQFLYASCFKLEETRAKDASLMELNRKYDALRPQHDAQIIQIYMESVIRMTPEKWSQTLYCDSEATAKAKAMRREQDTHKIKIGIESGNILTFEEWSNILYGDLTHKSEMQSIISTLPNYQIDKLKKLNSDFYGMIKYYGLEEISNFDKKDFDIITSINFDDSGHLRHRSTTTSETEQVHTLWALLLECLQSTFKILEAHADFSSKINEIIDNQNIIMSAKDKNLSLRQHGTSWNNKRPNIGGGNSYSQQQQLPKTFINSMSGSGHSEKQPLSQNRPQNNHGLKAMGTNSNQPYSQQQKLRNISKSAGVSTGSSSSSSRGLNTPYPKPDEMSIPNQDQQVFQPFSSKVQRQKPSSCDDTTNDRV